MAPSIFQVPAWPERQGQPRTQGAGRLNKLLNLFLAPLGLCRVVGWQNIYRSGYYHRCGKPTMFDRHPGDLYPTRAAAEADVDPAARHLYVATTKVVWYEESEPHVNSETSVPVPLSESRRKLAREPAGSYCDGVWQDPPRPLTEEEVQLALMRADSYGMWRG